MKHFLFIFSFPLALWAYPVIPIDPAAGQIGAHLIYGLEGAGTQIAQGAQRDLRILPSPEQNPWADRQDYAWSSVWSGNNSFQIADSIKPKEPSLLASYAKLPFNGMFFQAKFKRTLWGPWTIGLITQSHKVDSTQDFEYQASSHQPYLGLGRDSLSIPFNGRNLFFHHFGWSPEIEWNFGAHWQGQFQYQSWNHELDLPLREEPSYSLGDPKLLRKFSRLPWKLSEESQNWSLFQGGVKEEWTWLQSNQFAQSQTTKSLRPSWLIQNPGSKDTLWLKNTTNDSLIRIQQSFELKRKFAQSSFALNLDHEWTYLDLDQDPLHWNRSSLSEDRQKILLKSELPAQGLLLQAGAKRESNQQNQIELLPTYQLQWKDSSHFLFHKAQTSFEAFTPQAQFLQNDYLKMQLANEHLDAERKWDASYDLQATWDKYQVHGQLYSSYSQNPVVQLGTLVHNQITSALLEPFKAVNLDQEQRHYLSLGFALPLGHWKLNLDRQMKLYQQSTYLNHSYQRSDLPGTFWQGQLVWRDTLLQKHSLDLEVRFDWQYYGKFWDYSAQMQKGYSYSYEVPEELQLNFETRARIKTFQLFAQIQNLSHEYLHSVSGYTSPGLHLQWGITWNFDS